MARSIPTRIHSSQMVTTPGSLIGHLQWSRQFDAYIGDAVPVSIQQQRDHWYHWYHHAGAIAHLKTLYPSDYVDAVIMAKVTGDKRVAARTIRQSTRWIEDQIRRMQWDARAFITGTIE